MQAISMKCGVVSNVFWVRKSIPTSHKCVTFTDDLEIQGHVILYVPMGTT